MVCLDRSTMSYRHAVRSAEAIRDAQLARLRRAIGAVLARLSRPPGVIIVSGEGEFLARQAAASYLKDGLLVSLADMLGPIVSRVAPALALALLAREREGALP
jgi:uncharacterized hydantoinase/oxoprolinase family protein